MHYAIPLPQPGADGPRLAGGWLRFDRVRLTERGRADEIVPVTELPQDMLAPLIAPRTNVAGLDMSQPNLMGILNVTPDSFSDGGQFLSPSAARIQAEAMSAADILDIGGESTRPGARAVDADEECARILPVIETLAPGRRLSVDTRKAKVARAALAAGAVLVNDVSGMEFDSDMAATLAQTGAPLCLMHAQGTPETMQDDPRYSDVVLDVFDALRMRIARASAAGIPHERILADPGIGFGKTVNHNLALLKNMAVFHGLGVPLLLGCSRKSFIGVVGDAPDPAQRMPGTLAVTLSAVAQGVQVHRVHDVAQVAQGIALWQKVTGVNE